MELYYETAAKLVACVGKFRNGESSEGEFKANAGSEVKVVYVYLVDESGEELLDIKIYNNDDLVTMRCGPTGWVLEVLKVWLSE